MDRNYGYVTQSAMDTLSDPESDRITLTSRVQYLADRAMGISNSVGELRDKIVGSKPEPAMNTNIVADRVPSFEEYIRQIEVALERIDHRTTVLTNAF